MPITITLNQFGDFTPFTYTWCKVLKANGGVKANYDKPFRLSAVLDLSDLDNTIRCMRCVPERKDVLVKFILFCIKDSSTYVDDRRVQGCINTVEKYLNGDTNVRELIDIINTATNDVARVAARATYTSANDVTAARAYDYTYRLERQRQVSYFRKLLDGDI